METLITIYIVGAVLTFIAELLFHFMVGGLEDDAIDFLKYVVGALLWFILVPYIAITIYKDKPFR